MKTIRERLDGWVNSMTGLGGLRDKAQAAVFSRFGRTDDDTLEAMYEEDDMAAKIVEAGPEHMLRRGFNVVVEGEADTGPAVVKYLNDLGTLNHLTDALVWENVFGGAVMALGLDDGQDVSLPVDEDRIRNVLFINTLDRRDVLPVYWYSDPSSGKYGKPEVYRVTYISQGMQRPTGDAPEYKPHTMDIHESRLLVFTGLRTTFRARLRYNGWGVPYLSRLRVPLRGFHANWQSVENMMTDASQGVFKMKHLMEAITSGGLSALETRMRLLDMTRSVARAVLVDSDTEDFERKDTSMSGLPELLDRTASRLSAAASMPVTVVMGTSPGGLNATGASDVRNWYDVLEAQRTRRVQPFLERLVLLALKAKDGPTRGRVPPKWEVTFDSLWQETEGEKAATSLVKTQSDTALVAAGVITGAEVAIRRADELGIDTESREAEMQGYNAALADPLEGLPPRPMLGTDDPTSPPPAAPLDPSALVS